MFQQYEIPDIAITEHELKAVTPEQGLYGIGCHQQRKVIYIDFMRFLRALIGRTRRGIGPARNKQEHQKYNGISVKHRGVTFLKTSI